MKLEISIQPSLVLVLLSAVLVHCKRAKNTPDLVIDVRDLSETVATLRKDLNDAVEKISRQDDVIATLQKEHAFREDKCSQAHGWWRFDKSCYWFSPEGRQVNYDTARGVCNGKGKESDLALINSYEEAQFIARIADFTSMNSAWWIGCQYNSTKKDYMCVNGELMTYRKWSDGRPTGYSNARCLQMWKVPKVEMTDTQCNQRWSFVCERPLKRP